jgi:hypothetical protein
MVEDPQLLQRRGVHTRLGRVLPFLHDDDSLISEDDFGSPDHKFEIVGFFPVFGHERAILCFFDFRKLQLAAGRYANSPRLDGRFERDGESFDEILRQILIVLETSRNGRALDRSADRMLRSLCVHHDRLPQRIKCLSIETAQYGEPVFGEVFGLIEGALGCRVIDGQICGQDTLQTFFFRDVSTPRDEQRVERIPRGSGKSASCPH